MNEDKVTRELDAMQIIGILLKGWWIIVLAVVLCAGLAIGYAEFFHVDTYSSSATLLLNGGGEGNSVSSMAQQILAGQYQSKDYPYILNARDTMKEVADELNADIGENKYTASMISGMVKSESVEDSRIFCITVTGTDPEETQRVAEKVTEVFKKRVELLTKVNVAIVDNPAEPSNPSTPGVRKNAILGFAIGLIIGVAVAVMIGIANDAIESEDWIIEKYKDRIPLLSSVPDANSGGRSSYFKYKYGKRYGYRLKN